MVLLSDIGSFPKGKGKKGMRELVADIMRWKIRAGLDVPLYPQTRDMIEMFFAPIQKFGKAWRIQKEKAQIAEVKALENFAREYFEREGKALEFGVCITGPLELYAAKAGYVVDEGLLLNLARSVNAFARNAELNTKYLHTALLSLDEPTLGVNPFLFYEDEALIKALDLACAGVKCRTQIHLHAAAENELIYETKGIEVIGIESAENPLAMEMFEKRDLEKYDKFVRIGISRTNIFALEAEANKKITPALVNKLESIRKIRARYRNAKKIFGNRLAIVGPDCGLGSWPSQESAFVLLRNTVRAVRGENGD